MEQVMRCVGEMFDGGLLRHILVRAGRGEEILLDYARSADAPLDADVRFDLASITKILATTTLSLIASDRRLIGFDDLVSRFFACPEDKKDLTVRHLLTHSMGVGHRDMTKRGSTYENIQDEILQMPLDFAPGQGFAYSCPAFVLLGKILEQAFGDRLDRLFSALVAEPLGLRDTGFLPDRAAGRFVNSNPTPEEAGLVNDYNCRYLGGVAGNAGVFSTQRDLTAYAQFLLRRGEPLVRRETFEAAVRRQLSGDDESRAIGFLYVDARYAQTGELFPEGSVGHCGHTGQSLFVDLRTGFYALVLSDAAVNCREKIGTGYYAPVRAFRRRLHDAIAGDLGVRGA